MDKPVKITKNAYHIEQTRKILNILKNQKTFTVEEMMAHMKIHKMGYQDNEIKPE